MSIEGVFSRVTIDAPVDKVWDYLTTKYYWGSWWGSDIRKLDPGWEKGAELQFSGSYQPMIKIEELVPQEKMHFSMPYLRLKIDMQAVGDGSTEVVIHNEPDGASWPDGGANQKRIMDEKLARLKADLG